MHGKKGELRGLKERKLKRSLGLWEIVFYGVGVIVGAGIYALIGKTAGLAGNMAWLSFVLAALIASFTGLSFCELSSMFPKSASEFVYVKKAFGRTWGEIIGIITVFVCLVAAAAVAKAFDGYFAQFFSTSIPMDLVLIVLLSVLSFLGIKKSLEMNILFTLVTIGGLLIIIFLGLGHLGAVDYTQANQSLDGVFSATALIFFAYLGFEDIVNLGEEAKEPKKNIPLAIIITLAVTTLIYTLTALVSVSVVSYGALASSEAPLALVAESLLGSGALLSVIALFATTNTILVLLIVGSRMLYGMSKGRVLPSVLSRVHAKRGTPWVAVALIGVMALVLSHLGNMYILASWTNVFAFTIFAATNLALIRLRYSHPGKRPFRVPLNIGRFPILAFLGLVSSLFMLWQLLPGLLV